MKYFLFCVFVCVFIINSNGQNTFQILYGSTDQYSTMFGNDAIQTASGDYVVAGSTYNYSASGDDVFLLKTGADGTIKFFKIYTVAVDGFYKGSEAYSIKQTADGGFIIAGETYGVFGFTDAYILKTDSTGSVQWHRVFGGTQYDEARTIEQTGSGDFIIAGSTQSFGTQMYGGSNVYVLKLSPSGDLLWNNTYNSIDNNDGAWAVKETSDGNIIVAGVTTIGAVTHTAAMLLKVNSSDGSVIWLHTYGGNTSDEFCYGVEETANGFILAGSTNINEPSYSDAFLLKTNVAGDSIQWIKAYGNADSATNENAYSLIKTSEGGFALYGSIFFWSNSHLYELLIKTDNAGNISWINVHGSGNNDYGNKILQTSDNGYLLSSFEVADFGFLGLTAHITKTDVNGISGCNDSSIDIETSSPAFIVGNGPIASGAGNNIPGNETVQMSDEDLPVTILCENPPPQMKFLGFNGTNNNGKNILKWTTTGEVKTDYYKIERSNDARTFVTIGKQNATYKTLKQAPYKFTDNTRIKGRIYYMIKAIHSSGNITNSKIIAVTTLGNNAIAVSNTNVPGIFLMQADEFDSPSLSYIVYNSIGQKVYYGKLENINGKIFSKIDLSFLSSGVYFITFNSAKITNQQIIIFH